MQTSDLRRQAPLQVRFIGKGNKERICPLWSETVQAIDTCLHSGDDDGRGSSALFLNAKGEPITRFGIRHIVQKHATKAALVCPPLTTKQVSPHLVRHYVAGYIGATPVR